MSISPQARVIFNTEGEHEVANLNTLRFGEMKDRKKEGKTLGHSEQKFQVQATENGHLELNIRAF